MSADPSYKPTKADLAAAAALTVPDLIAPDLSVLFCGINPGLYTAATQRHFGRPGNRFWPALHRSGFTPRLLSPWEGKELLAMGIGITNMVERTTATAAELSRAEFEAGGKRLVRLVEKYEPNVVAFLGIGAYRSAFARKHAKIGLQHEAIRDCALWVLPSPSGLNANHQLGDLVRLLGELKSFVSDRNVSLHPSAR